MKISDSSKKVMTITTVFVAMFGIAFCMLIWLVELDQKDKMKRQQGQVFNMDGCEYIRFNTSVIHKANCTNNIHMRRLE